MRDRDICTALPRPRRNLWLVRSSVRWVVVLGALMPGLGCYLVIIYTYLLQFDRVLAFRSPDCDNVTNSFPPVSFVIGVWEPQRFFWQFLVIIHLPPRLCFGALYSTFYSSSDCKHVVTSWYRFCVSGYAFGMLLEAIALISLSIIDLNAHYVMHAFFYVVWAVAFNFNILFSTILHHFSGFRNRSSRMNKLFYFKICLFCTSMTLAISTAFTYPHYLISCSGWAYTTFSITEYLLVGVNTLFHSFCFWELPDVELGLVANFEKYLKVHKSESNTMLLNRVERNWESELEIV